MGHHEVGRLDAGRDAHATLHQAPLGQVPEDRAERRGQLGIHLVRDELDQLRRPLASSDHLDRGAAQDAGAGSRIQHAQPVTRCLDPLGHEVGGAHGRQVETVPLAMLVRFRGGISLADAVRVHRGSLAGFGVWNGLRGRRSRDAGRLHATCRCRRDSCHEAPPVSGDAVNASSAATLQRPTETVPTPRAKITRISVPGQAAGPPAGATPPFSAATAASHASTIRLDASQSPPSTTRVTPVTNEARSEQR